MVQWCRTYLCSAIEKNLKFAILQWPHFHPGVESNLERSSLIHTAQKMFAFVVFLFLIFRIWSEYSVPMRENADQKTCDYRHFSLSAHLKLLWNQIIFLIEKYYFCKINFLSVKSAVNQQLKLPWIEFLFLFSVSLQVSQHPDKISVLISISLLLH